MKFLAVRNKLKKFKQDESARKEQIRRQKAYDKLTIEKKTEVRKKINDFRKVSVFTFINAG
jgi:hypothetical protein